MQLSIVMMVKNESKNLRKSLESLIPVLKNIKSELIIMDTGSEDNTVEIAKEYTEKVYFCEWNNNFADMRNKSISYAKGMWIFIVDGDEMLESPQDIIDFFIQDKYKKYNTGFIEIRNYTNTNKYNSNTIARFFKNNQNFKYEGAIHEQPVIINPIYFFKSYFIHYGYFSQDLELMERKFNRNITILKQELEKNPMDIYYWHQLAQSYHTHNNLEESLKIALKAYNLAKLNNIDLSKRMYIYTHLALLYFKTCKYQELENLCMEAISIREGYIDIYFFLGQAQKYLGKNLNAIESYDKYIQILNNENEKAIKNDITVTLYSIDMKEYVYADLCLISYKEKKYREVINYSNKILTQQILDEIIAFLIDSFIREKMYKELTLYYDVKIKSFENEFIEKFFMILENQLLALDKSDKVMLWEFYSKERSEYGFLNNVRVALNEDKNLDEEYIFQNTKKINLTKSPSFYGDIIFYLIKKYTNVTRIIGNIREDKLENYIYYLKNQYGNEFISSAKRYILNSEISCETIEMKLIKILCKCILIEANISENEYEIIFNYYITNGANYIINIYHHRIIEEIQEEDLKNDEEAFLIHIFHAKKNMNKDMQAYIKHLRYALSYCPKMNKGIEMMIEESTKYQKNQIENVDEMKAYKSQLKEKIYSLIEEGFISEAKDTINGYESVIEEDIDIYSIKGVIAMIERNFNVAENIFKEGLNIDDKNFDLAYNLGYLYQIREKKYLAKKFYKKALQNARNENEENQVHNQFRTLGFKKEIYKSKENNYNSTWNNIISEEENKTYEMDKYKSEFKNKIDSLIKSGLLEDARIIVEEYQKIVRNDIDVYSIKGVIAMMEGDLDEAESILKEGNSIEPLNHNILYNLAYLYELSKKYVLAYKSYRSLFHFEEENIKDEIKEKIKQLEEIEEVKKYLIDNQDEIKAYELIEKMQQQIKELKEMTI